MPNWYLLREEDRTAYVERISEGAREQPGGALLDEDRTREYVASLSIGKRKPVGFTDSERIIIDELVGRAQLDFSAPPPLPSAPGPAQRKPSVVRSRARDLLDEAVPPILRGRALPPAAPTPPVHPEPAAPRENPSIPVPPPSTPLPVAPPALPSDPPSLPPSPRADSAPSPPTPALELSSTDPLHPDNVIAEMDGVVDHDAWLSRFLSDGERQAGRDELRKKPLMRAWSGVTVRSGAAPEPNGHRIGLAELVEMDDVALTRYILRAPLSDRARWQRNLAIAERGFQKIEMAMIAAEVAEREIRHRSGPLDIDSVD